MRGFVEQLLHYFGRPHLAPPTAPVGGPAAWMGSDLANSDAWQERLSAGQVEELRRALEKALASGRPAGELTAQDFPLPTLGGAIGPGRSELTEGRGFQACSACDPPRREA